MMFLLIRSDNPQAELVLYSGEARLDGESWHAHRKLAETLHTKIRELLDRNNVTLAELAGIGAYSGPGSFTGLRIGLSVANALAASYGLPIAGSSGEHWDTDAVSYLLQGSANKLPLVPEYGAPVHITPQRR